MNINCSLQLITSLKLLHGSDIGGLNVFLEIGSELLLKIIKGDELILNNDSDLELLDSVSDWN